MRDQGRETQGQSVQLQVYTFKLAQGVSQDYMAGLQRMISAVNKLADATRYMLGWLLRFATRGPVPAQIVFAHPTCHTQA